MTEQFDGAGTTKRRRTTCISRLRPDEIQLLRLLLVCVILIVVGVSGQPFPQTLANLLLG